MDDTCVRTCIVGQGDPGLKCYNYVSRGHGSVYDPLAAINYLSKLSLAMTNTEIRAVKDYKLLLKCIPT